MHLKLGSIYNSGKVAPSFWRDKTNHYDFFKYAAKQLNVHKLDDWYDVETSEFIKLGGRTLLKNYYGNSLHKALTELYPQHNWLPWKFKSLPKGSWQEINTQRSFFQQLTKTLNIQSPEDWYHIQTTTVIKHGGGAILSHHSSLSQSLMNVYPHVDWKPWLFDTLPKNYFNELANQKKFFEWAVQKLNIQKDEDWYSVTSAQVNNIGGTSLLNMYGGSLVSALNRVYLEKNFVAWRFGTVPNGYWDQLQNRREYLDWLASQLSIRVPEDWYKVTFNDISTYHGAGLIRHHYNGSIARSVLELYPEYNLLPWRFRVAPRGWWDSLDNQRRYLDWIAATHNIKHHENWYQIPVSVLSENNGKPLLSRYSHSMSKILQTLYPEIQWDIFKFKQLPKGYWGDKDNVKKFLQTLGPKLGVKQLNDWYSISEKQFQFYKGGSLLTKSGGLHALLSKVYPNHDWSSVQAATPSKSQVFLYRMIQTLFPNTEVFLDYPHPKLVFQLANRPMELDVYIPSLNLAFEYQGQQHYTSHYLYGSANSQKERDTEKRRQCKELGITLIDIPYWWNYQQDSLIATIHKFRPELFPESTSRAIPDENPKPSVYRSFDFFQIEFRTANSWDSSKDPTSWWVSEKLDGVRAIWNGKGQLCLPNGKVLPAPESLTKQLPSIPLEGQLWAGRNLQYPWQDVLKSNNSELWSKLTYYIFDTPSEHLLLYEERIALLRDKLGKCNSQIQLVNSVACNGKEHLEELYNDILKRGGKGVVLKKPKSYYYDSQSFFKLEKQQEDVLVVGKEGTQLLCERSSGEQIRLDANASIPVDAIVTVSNERDFIKVRYDKTWRTTPYFVSTGNTTGRQPRCSGCKKEFSKVEPRVQIIATFQPLNTAPYLGKVNMCMNTQCIDRARANLQTKGVELPLFNGKVAYRKSFDTSLPSVNGIEWVVMK